mmetsp:Transcript_103052/g.204571  ORF Transcript_103052/g.204571 Transcript_103052/m.204571 type:complete len:642 (-) Transcript_103052:238-2163(-)
MEKSANNGSAQHLGLPPGLSVQTFWTDEECRGIEQDINTIKVLADAGKLKTGTLDRSPLRSKYFFGYGYTYGAQVAGKGQEQLLPPECVDPIPDWVHDKLIARLEERGLVEKGWINSAVVNDYMPGGMIVSHIDPKQLFARPIFICSFFADGRLSFGVQFAFEERRFCSEKSSAPKYLARMPRGSVTTMDGFSADGITHGIRPEDLEGRRVSVVLRHVFPHAPTLQDTEAMLKSAQRGAPATAARRLFPAGGSLVSNDEQSNDASPMVGSSVGITKRVLEFESAEDERPSKQRRSEIAVQMLQDIKGVYSDERSGNTYEISADGAVRVTFTPKAFGMQPQESTTWKIEVSADKLICGKGELLPSGIRHDRLVWSRRDRVGSDLVWLRVMDNSEGNGDEANEQGQEHEDKPTEAPTAGQAALVAWLQRLQQPVRVPSPQLTLWGAGRGDAPAVPPPKLMPLPRSRMVQRHRPLQPRRDQFLRPVHAHTRPAMSPRGPTPMVRNQYSAGPGRPRPGMGAGTPLAFQRQTLGTSLSPDHPGPFKAAAAAGLLGPRVVPREEERAPHHPAQAAPPETLQLQPVDVELPDRKWYYKDAEGNVQGPYAAAAMSEWSRQGFFPETLLVKAEDEQDFSELGNGMRLLMA